MKTGKLFIIGLIIVLAAACGPAATSIAVTTKGGNCILDAGDKIAAGDVTVTWTVNDDSASIYGLWFLTLDKGKGYQDLVDYTSADGWANDFPPSWAHWQGDIYPAEPGSQNEKTLALQEGPIYLVCLAGTSSVFAGEVEVYGILGPIKVVR